MRGGRRSDSRSAASTARALSTPAREAEQARDHEQVGAGLGNEARDAEALMGSLVRRADREPVRRCESFAITAPIRRRVGRASRTVAARLEWAHGRIGID
jgi:hypothetical protein